MSDQYFDEIIFLEMIKEIYHFDSWLVKEKDYFYKIVKKIYKGNDKAALGALSFSVRVCDAAKIVLYSKYKGVKKEFWFHSLEMEEDNAV